MVPEIQFIFYIPLTFKLPKIHTRQFICVISVLSFFTASASSVSGAGQEVYAVQSEHVDDTTWIKLMVRINFTKISFRDMTAPTDRTPDAIEMWKTTAVI